MSNPHAVVGTCPASVAHGCVRGKGLLDEGSEPSGAGARAEGLTDSVMESLEQSVHMK